MGFIIENIFIVLIILTFITFTIFLFFKKNKNHSQNYKISESELKIKLHAYERLILFLERIEPVGMLNRLSLHDVNVKDLKSILIKRIITEYEYNVSQQIYVPSKLWKLIESAKNLTISNIVTVSESLNDDSKVEHFVSKILISSESSRFIFQKSKEMLRNEVLKLSKIK
ncbi:MAG: hypothetical protein CMP65_00340 [Flavobacteriales bacterium]|nr:hypothetical protein [Flavobacteriales bacterium]|tara:strand:- start:25883 stop:26392 length:510 start_codon:yes stop_codon:yes gene_type:complete